MKQFYSKTWHEAPVSISHFNNGLISLNTDHIHSQWHIRHMAFRRLSEGQKSFCKSKCDWIISLPISNYVSGLVPEAKCLLSSS